eukprot:1445609-Rhodomonas_salina.2
MDMWTPEMQQVMLSRGNNLVSPRTAYSRRAISGADSTCLALQDECAVRSTSCDERLQAAT